MAGIKTDYLSSPVGRTLFLKSLPMSLGIFASIAYNLVDTYFVAKLGTQELAAMSFCYPVVMIILTFMMGVATGVNSLASRSLGAKDDAHASDVAKKGLQFTFISSLCITLLGLLTIEPLFYFLGVDESLMPLVKEYMNTWYAGVVFMNMATVGSSIFRAKGNIFYPSLILILGALLNAILDPILIFGWGPIPAIGVQGAALTTVFGNALSSYFLFLRLSKKEQLPFSSIFTSFDLSLIKKILVIAIPTALANSIIPVSTALTNLMLVPYGNAAVAANSIATRIETAPFIAIFALSSVLAPFIGQNWGAKNYGRIREALKKSFIFSHLLGAAFAFMYIFKKTTISAFFDRSPQVVEITSIYFSAIPLTYGVLGTIFLTTHAMNAIGKPFSANFLSASRLVLLYLPVAFVLNIYAGIKGIFLARFIANLVVGLLATALTYRVFFKKREDGILLVQDLNIPRTDS